MILARVTELLVFSGHFLMYKTSINVIILATCRSTEDDFYHRNRETELKGGKLGSHRTQISGLFPLLSSSENLVVASF